MIRKLIVLLSIVSVSAKAQQITQDSISKIAFSKSILANRNFNFRIPFELSKSTGLVVLKIKIENKEYRLIFDTGAEISVFDIKNMDKSAFRTHNKTNVKDSNSEIAAVDAISFNKIEIGQLKIEDVYFQAIKSKDWMICDSIDGIIGNNIISKLNWYFDYDNLVVTISDKELGIKNAVKTINYFLFNRTPHTSIEIGGEVFNSALIDYGNNSQFRIPFHSNKSVDSFIYSKKYEAFSGFTWGILGFKMDTSRIIHIPQLKISNNHFDSVEVYVSKNGSRPNIGHRLLSRYNVGIDTKNKKIYLSERVNKIKNKTLFKPLQMKWEENKIIIDNVMLCSTAYEKGFKIGDLIEKINDKSAADFNDSCSFDTWFIKIDTLEIDTKNGGKFKFEREKPKLFMECQN